VQQSRDRKLEHLKKGDEYAKEKKDEFAVIEYASAVELDPKFGEARLKLAKTYERLNNFQAAFQEYIRAGRRVARQPRSATQSHARIADGWSIR
jgi:Tfp pilus assembly protein PilF